MTTEFNLSKRIAGCEETTEGYYEPKDVKEFIKRLKEELFILYGHETGGTIGELNQLIDKLAGDKLI